MPATPAIAAAGPRDPVKRPRPIPKAVRAAILLMVYGKPDDPDCGPVDFVAAAKLVDLKPFVLRRYFDRGAVRALLLSERRAFRAMICSGNEAALKDIRDKSANFTARIGAIRTLEELADSDASHSRNSPTPGVTINILPAPPSRELVDVGSFRPVPPVVVDAQRAPVTIDAQPVEPRHDAAGHRVDAQGYPLDERGNRVFTPKRDW